MKRYTDPIVVLVLLLLLCCATACSAIEYPTPCGRQAFSMQRGWYQGGPAWYVGLSTSSIKFAFDFDLTFVPKLASATAEAGGAAKLYWVTNSPNFGVVFDTAPGFIQYSGLWDVQYVKWLPGVVPWVITRTDIVGAAPGLPDASQADITDSDIILDYPIVALGPLGGSWLPAPLGTYRIPQGTVRSDYIRTKVICLPTFEVFCTNEIHRSVHKEKVVITDVTDPDLAFALGANLAPALLDVDEENQQDFWFIEGGPYLCQKPVIEHCPDMYAYSWLNKNFKYSPIMEFERLSRSPFLPPSTVINNPDYLEYLEDIGLLEEVDDDDDDDDIVINANVIQLIKRIAYPAP